MELGFWIAATIMISVIIMYGLGRLVNRISVDWAVGRKRSGLGCLVNRISVDTVPAMAAADFKNLFGVSHTTSLAQQMINTAYRAARDELKGLKDEGVDGLDLKQISERSAEIDTAVQKLKGLKTMAEALGFTVPDEKE